MRRFFNYVKMLIKNIVFFSCVVLDIIGLFIVYFGTFDIPMTVFYLLPICGLIYSGFDIYKKTSPEIVITPVSSDEIKINCMDADTSWASFLTTIELHITNSGYADGIIKSPRFDHGTVNDTKDDFLLSKIGFSIDKLVVYKKKPVSLSDDSLDSKSIMKENITIKPGEIETLHLRVKFSVNGSDTSDFERTMDWLKYVDVMGKIPTVESGFKSEKPIKIRLDLKDLIKIVKEKIVSDKELDEAFNKLLKNCK